MQRVRNSINELEKLTGMAFGVPEKPLLLSVRSGSAMSMPGMMSTIHNVGLNEELVNEYVQETGRGYFAWDNYRRFLQSWAMARGLDREEFQELMNAHKQRYNVYLKREFSPLEMQELALEYKRLVMGQGVVKSLMTPGFNLSRPLKWSSIHGTQNKAQEYRHLMGCPRTGAQP